MADIWWVAFGDSDDDVRHMLDGYEADETFCGLAAPLEGRTDKLGDHRPCDNCSEINARRTDTDAVPA